MSPVLFLPDEAGYVDMCESGHQVLTVKSVHDAAVARDGVGKVLKEKKRPRHRNIRARVAADSGMNKGTLCGVSFSLIILVLFQNYLYILMFQCYTLRQKNK